MILALCLCLFSLVSAQTGWLAETPALPVSLGEVAAAVVSNSLYIVGQGSSATCKLVLSPRGSSWDCSLAARPFAGNHHAVVVPTASSFWLVGGLDSGSEGKVQVYDIAANTWSTFSLPAAFGGSLCAGMVNNLVIVCGGITNRATITTCAAIDPASSNTALTLPDMPVGVNHASFVSDGADRFFVIGGRGGDNVPSAGFDTLQIFTLSTNTWASSNTANSLAPLPQARGGMGAGLFINGEIYVIGGETPRSTPNAPTDGVYTRVDIYNPSTNTWRRGPDLPQGMHGIYPVFDGTNIHIVGGGVQVGFSGSSLFYTWAVQAGENTVAPTTLAPTTIVPTTIAPTTIAPTTAAATQAPVTSLPVAVTGTSFNLTNLNNSALVNTTGSFDAGNTTSLYHPDHRGGVSLFYLFFLLFLIPIGFAFLLMCRHCTRRGQYGATHPDDEFCCGMLTACAVCCACDMCCPGGFI